MYPDETAEKEETGLFDHLSDQEKAQQLLKVIDRHLPKLR